MKKTIGIISANYTNDRFGGLLEGRTMASMPVGGRYRFIDFPLSNMVNSGITTVGLITPYDYRSLMDHVGVGKPWGLDRKVGGLFVMPGAVYGIRMDNGKFLQRDLLLNRKFIDIDTADYVLFSGTNGICSIDFTEMIAQHEKNAYPITLAYRKTQPGESYDGLFLEVDEENRVQSFQYRKEGSGNYFLDGLIIDREFLVKFLDWFGALTYMDVMDIIRDNLKDIGADAYEFKGYVGVVNTISDYIRVSMDLLDNNVRFELFGNQRKIYTKVQDESPTLFRTGSHVKNSMVATGCIIEGSVERSIVSRNIQIKAGAVVEDSIIMQGVTIGENAVVKHAIIDKYSTIGPGVRLEGSDNHPVIVNKNEEI